VATLRAAGVSDQEIVEVIATVAVNICTNYFNQSLPSERITPGRAAGAPRLRRP
jgi:hypothetical protein